MPPDIILNNGQILATQTDSGLGIEIQTPGFLFASVVMVSDTTDNSTLGQTFLFKESKAVTFKYGSTIYYQLHEDDVNFKEVLPP